jgi:ketosteroid isomerase-like protein
MQHEQQTTSDALRQLEASWAQAERQGDVEALRALTAEDFRLVGPVGFVLDREQWLSRYRGGDLVTHELSLEEPETRIFGDTALTIGRHVQQAEYQGRPVDGAFRATHIAVRERGRWVLAGIQLSPIGGPPPFAPAQAASAPPAQPPGPTP